MKTRTSMWAWAGLAMLFVGTAAQAVTMKVQPASIYQYGSGSGVYLGHTVAASTNINRLTAGGSFRASCLSILTGDITGERTLPGASLLGGVQLYVTIPAQLPALRNMPGFESVSRGQRIECSYRWTAFAREGTYTIGTPGTSMPIGGGEIYDSGAISFWMRKPGTATGNDDACIP
jgi:hypothetical protein